MLVNKNDTSETKQSFVVGEVTAIKLISGEEIVAKVEAISSSDVTLHCPLAIGITREGNPALRPYMLTLNWESAVITISYAHIMGAGSCRRDIEVEYIRNSTGIEIVTPGSL